MVGLSLYHVKVFCATCTNFFLQNYWFCCSQYAHKNLLVALFSIQIAQEKLYKNFILFCAKCLIYKFWKIWKGMERYSWYFYTHSKIFIVYTHSKILHVMICISLHVIYFYTHSKIFIVSIGFIFFIVVRHMAYMLYHKYIILHYIR